MAARLYVRQLQPDAAWTSWTGAPSGFPFNPTDSWSRIPFNINALTTTSPLSSTSTTSKSSTTSSTAFSSLSSTSIKTTSVPLSQTPLGATTTTAIPTPSHITSSRAVNVPAIGGAVGGIIVLILLLLFCYIIYRKKRLRRKTPTHIEVPYLFVSENARALPDKRGEISQLVVGEVQHPNTLSQSIKQRSGNIQARPEPIVSRQTGDNQEELSTQIRQIQQTMTELQSQLMHNTQVDARALEADHPSDRDVRQEILILRSEIERLQASQEEVIRVQNNMDHLPDYDETV